MITKWGSVPSTYNDVRNTDIREELGVTSRKNTVKMKRRKRWETPIELEVVTQQQYGGRVHDGGIVRGYHTLYRKAERASCSNSATFPR